MATKKQQKNTNSNKKSESFGKQKRKQSVKASNVGSNNSIIDSGAKKDILAVVFIVVGAAIFAVSLIPTDAPITSLIVNFLRFVFGIGLYIFPFFLIVIGISFFFKMERQKISVRVTVGLCLIFVAILSLISLCSPTLAANKPEGLFDIDAINNFGGIIGSSFSWLGFTLLGNIVTAIFMVGMIVIGLIVIGLSVSNIVARINERKEDIERFNEPEIKPKRKLFNRKDNVINPNANIPTNAIFNQDGMVLVDDNGNVVTSDAQNLANMNTAAIDPSMIGEDGIIDPDSVMSMQERAINNNAGKKPGLKTRILGFKNDDIPLKDNLSFDPSQNQTKQLEANFDDPFCDNNLDIPEIDLVQNNVVPTQIIDSDNTQVIEPKKSTNNQKNKSKKINNQNNNKKNNKSSISSAVSNAAPKPLEGFQLPNPNILAIKNPDDKEIELSDDELKSTAANLQKTLADFGIKAKVVGWVAGPTVTLFKVDLPAGVRVSRITALNDDIALALAAPGVRVFAPIPGTTFVGIEVPNITRQTVLLSDVLKSAKKGPLEMAIGKDVEGHCIVTDLAKMPHLLIGGTTGSGKSVSINAMIMSILMRATPSEVRLILIDPKRVEFTPYNGIPHLYVPVVTEPKEAASALSWGVAEMESRLKTFSQIGVRNIGSYNSKVQKMSEEEKQENNLEELPYIVIIIDELADLMMAVGKEVEYSISRIAQLARAAGIHLIVATQRPSTNVVTGLIKANITNRIAFNVASGIDSRVILDTGGAESLIGLGDMLLNKPELSKPLRIQGCYVSEDEVEAVVEHLKSQGEPEYHNDILKTNLISVGADQSAGGGANGSSDDDLFWEAAEMIVNAQHGSTSSLQRRFKIGYSRAGRIMDMLEEKGIVSPQNGSKPREVLVDLMELEGIKALESYNDNN